HGIARLGAEPRQLVTSDEAVSVGVDAWEWRETGELLGTELTVVVRIHRLERSTILSRTTARGLADPDQGGAILLEVDPAVLVRVGNFRQAIEGSAARLRNLTALDDLIVIGVEHLEERLKIDGPEPLAPRVAQAHHERKNRGRGRDHPSGHDRGGPLPVG